MVCSLSLSNFNTALPDIPAVKDEAAVDGLELADDMSRYLIASVMLKII